MHSALPKRSATRFCVARTRRPSFAQIQTNAAAVDMRRNGDSEKAYARTRFVFVSSSWWW